MIVQAKPISIKKRELATPAEILVALFFLPAYMDKEKIGLLCQKKRSSVDFSPSHRARVVFASL